MDYYGIGGIMEQTYEYKKSRSYTKKDGSVSYYDNKVKYKPDYKESDERMSRCDRGEKHMKKRIVFSEKIDGLLRKADRETKMLRYLFNALKGIKTHGMYTGQEKAQEEMTMNSLNTPSAEKEVLGNAWESRHIMNNKLKRTVKDIHDALIDYHKQEQLDEFGNDEDIPILEGIEQVKAIIGNKTIKRKEEFDAYMDGFKNASDKHRDKQTQEQE